MITAASCVLAAALIFTGASAGSVREDFAADTDGDGSADQADAVPYAVNPLINYIIVGEDYDGEDVFSDEVAVYEQLLDEAGMEWMTLHIDSWDEFNLFWQNMKSMNADGTVNSLELYRGVDNLIIECHGNEGGLLLDPYDGYEGINIADFELLGQIQSAPIISADIRSCYSGCMEEDTNAAYEMAENCDVGAVYGWDGLVYFDPDSRSSCYKYPESDGHFLFYRDGSAVVTERIEADRSFFDPDEDADIFFFRTVLRSTASAR